MQTGASGFRSIGVDKVVVNESTQKIREFSPEKRIVVCLKKRPHYSRQSVAGGMDVPSVPNVEGSMPEDG